MQKLNFNILSDLKNTLSIIPKVYLFYPINLFQREFFYLCFCFFLDVPSSPYGVKVIELSQTMAKVSFNKPDSHGGVPIHHYQVDVKEVTSETWKIVRSHGVQSE